MKRTASLLDMLALLLLVTTLVSACGDSSKNATEKDSVPAGVQPSDVNKLPQDIQTLEITIDSGRFGHDRYEMQQGAVQLVIRTIGGPYTFVVDKLIASRELPADVTTTIGVNVASAGEYTMKLTGQTEATAILNVRAPGGR